MHELSIAISIVEVATEQLERHGGKWVEAVHLRVGPLSGVIKEALESAYELACEETPLAGSRLIVENVPVEILCGKCGGPQAVESIQRMCCKVCGTPSSQIVRGRELELFSMEISDEERTAAG